MELRNWLDLDGRERFSDPCPCPGIYPAPARLCLSAPALLIPGPVDCDPSHWTHPEKSGERVIIKLENNERHWISVKQKDVMKENTGGISTLMVWASSDHDHEELDDPGVAGLQCPGLLSSQVCVWQWPAPGDLLPDSAWGEFIIWWMLIWMTLCLEFEGEIILICAQLY